VHKLIADMYEYWSAPVDWTKPENEGWIQWVEGMQAVTHLLDAWICCFPSDVFEPEAYDAACKDPLITARGGKPLFQLDWHEFPPQALEDDVKAFLDRQPPKSVVFVRSVSDRPWRRVLMAALARCSMRVKVSSNCLRS
jgi:hypothetical protein